MKNIELYLQKHVLVFVSAILFMMFIAGIVVKAYAVDTVNVWKPTGADTLASTAANWNQGRIPSVNDSVRLNGDTANRKCFVDYRLVCKAFLRRSTHTETFAIVAGGITVAGQYRDSSAGVNNWGVSVDTVGGNVVFVAANTFDAGTSTLVLNGTAAQTVTLHGKTLYTTKVSRATVGTLTFSDSLKSVDYIVLSTNTQAIAHSGQVIVVGGNSTLDGSGGVTLGTALVANGASSSVHFGSTNTFVAAMTSLQMNTLTNGIIDDDEGIYLFSIMLGANAIVTSSGSAITFLYASTNIITLGASASLTLSSVINAYELGGGDAWSAAAGSSLSISSGKFLNCRAAAGNEATLPALTGTGAGFLQVNTFSNASSVKLTGHLSLGTLGFRLGTYQSTGTSFVNLNDFNITCGPFSVGNGTAAGGTFNCGSGLIQCSSFAPLANISGFNFNMMTSQWTCAGAWTFDSNWTVDAGTSIVTSTGNALFTSNGKSFYDLTVNNAGTGSFRNADSLSLTGDLTLTDGRDSLMQQVRCVDYTNNTLDSVFHGANVFLSGAFVRGVGTKVKRAAGSMIFTGTGTQPITLNNNAIGPIVNSKASGTLAFADSGKVQKYTATADSLLVTFSGAKGIRFDTTDTGSLNGIAGKLNSYRAASGTARLHLPAVYALSYTDWSFITVSPVDQIADNGTNFNGGNNTGFIFPVSGASGRRRAGMGLRLDLGLGL